MKSSLMLLACVCVAAPGCGNAGNWDAQPTAARVSGLSASAPAPSFSQLVTLPLAIEGLTSDRHGNLYTPDRRGATAVDLPCTIWKMPASGGAPLAVGQIQPLPGRAAIRAGWPSTMRA